MIASGTKIKFLAVGILLLGLAACMGIEGEASMQVWLDAPLDGRTFSEGETVLLHTHARDVNGAGIDQIHYYANDRLLAIGEADASLPLVHSFFGWNPSEAGTYEVYTKAISVNGGSAESAHVNITITDLQQATSEVLSVEGSATSTTTEKPLTPTPTITQVTSTLTITPVTPTLTPSPTWTNTKPPPEVFLYAKDTSLNAGECTTLTWESANTNRLTLNDLPVSNYSGSTRVCPVTNITYTLTGYYSGGTVSDSVTIRVNYNFPAQQFSVYAGISITGGHGGIHHIGDTLQICYYFDSDNYIFEFRDYSPASIGQNGTTGPYNILAQGTMFDSQNVCKNYTLVAPAGYEAFQFRIKRPSEGGEVLVDIAELWIYVLP